MRKIQRADAELMRSYFNRFLPTDSADKPKKRKEGSMALGKKYAILHLADGLFTMAIIALPNFNVLHL